MKNTNSENLSDEQLEKHVEMVEGYVEYVKHQGIKETLLLGTDEFAGEPMKAGPAQSIAKTMYSAEITRIAAEVILLFVAGVFGSLMFVLATSLNKSIEHSIPDHVDPEQAYKMISFSISILILVVAIFWIVFKDIVNWANPEHKIFASVPFTPNYFATVNKS